MIYRGGIATRYAAGRGECLPSSPPSQSISPFRDTTQNNEKNTLNYRFHQTETHPPAILQYTPTIFEQLATASLKISSSSLATNSTRLGRSNRLISCFTCSFLLPVRPLIYRLRKTCPQTFLLDITVILEVQQCHLRQPRRRILKIPRTRRIRTFSIYNHKLGTLKLT